MKETRAYHNSESGTLSPTTAYRSVHAEGEWYSINGIKLKEIGTTQLMGWAFDDALILAYHEATLKTATQLVYVPSDAAEQRPW